MTTSRLDTRQTLKGMQDVLFDVQPFTIEPEALLSAGRRRTARQHMLVTLGIHPLAKRPTRPELGHCGDCRFRQLIQHNARVYPKCTFAPERMNHSVSTDCRAWWPACPSWEPKEIADAQPAAV